MRHLPAYLALVHPYAVGVVLLTTAALALLVAEGVPEPGRLLRLIGVVALSQACVGISNELHDLPIDRAFRPEKPLVSGRAQPGPARLAALAAGLGALLLGLTFGALGLLFAALGTAAGLIYNYWLKGTPLSWLPYAVGFSVLPLWPFVALERWNPALGAIWLPVLPASVALNLAQSLGDIEHDSAHGIRGLAALLGRRLAPAALLISGLLAVALALLSAPQQAGTVPLLPAAVTSAALVVVAGLRCYLRPGQATWLLGWRLTALAMALLAVAWLGALLQAPAGGL